MQGQLFVVLISEPLFFVCLFVYPAQMLWLIDNQMACVGDHVFTLKIAQAEIYVLAPLMLSP